MLNSRFNGKIVSLEQFIGQGSERPDISFTAIFFLFGGKLWCLIVGCSTDSLTYRIFRYGPFTESPIYDLYLDIVRVALLYQNIISLNISVNDAFYFIIFIVHQFINVEVSLQLSIVVVLY